MKDITSTFSSIHMTSVWKLKAAKLHITHDNFERLSIGHGIRTTSDHSVPFDENRTMSMS